jgi:hypothetical protein
MRTEVADDKYYTRSTDSVRSWHAQLEVREAGMRLERLATGADSCLSVDLS